MRPPSTRARITLQYSAVPHRPPIVECADAVAQEEKKASQLAERLGSAMPHASRAGPWSGRSALAVMERRAARERGAPWRGMSMDVQTMHRRELAGGRHRPGLGGEGGPTQGSGTSGHLPSGGAR